MGQKRESILAKTRTTNKKCPNCLKVSKIALDNGIPLPSQSCPYCGFKII